MRAGGVVSRALVPASRRDALIDTAGQLIHPRHNRVPHVCDRCRAVAVKIVDMCLPHRRTGATAMAEPVTWRDAMIELADLCYRLGHEEEARASDIHLTVPQAKAEVYAFIYGELCQVVNRVDPRPGASAGFGRMW